MLKTTLANIARIADYQNTRHELTMRAIDTRRAIGDNRATERMLLGLADLASESAAYRASLDARSVR